MKERVLHIALRVAGDPQAALERALRSIASEYAEVVWTQTPREELADRIGSVAYALRPTLVFAQIQTAGVLSPAIAYRLRKFGSPECVLVQWDGDQHHEPGDPERQWFIDLGREFDASLICNTRYPKAYSKMGVRRCGYLQIGVDVDIWKPTQHAPNTPEIVMLASDYPHLSGYDRRVDICRKLTAAFPERFAVYGHGWRRPDVASRPFLEHAQEAPVLSAAKAVLSMSIRNDLPHYTSDRLFRCLASGALTLVEEFPGYADLGLEHERNCLLWRTWADLQPQVVRALLGYPQQAEIRAAARGLAVVRHTWDARMSELLELVERIRKERP